MIDRAKFQNAWTHLCSRFNRPDDGRQAAAYYDFLSAELDTDQFLQSARALWASSKFFPSPGEFITVHAQGEWPIVLEVARGYCPPEWGWIEHWKKLTPRAQEACKRLGGVDVVRGIYERDSLKLKAEWERAFEQAIQADALALPAPDNPRHLRPA